MAAAPRQINYGILFPGPTDGGCICVREKLGSGAQSTAQLVFDRDTRQNIVRKYSRKAYNGDRLLHRPDRETRICNAIEAKISELSPRPRPNIARIRGTVNLQTEANSTEVQVTSFWDYYNVGSTVSLSDAYKAANTMPPTWIIARYIRQVLEAVNWMMHQIEPAVFHMDLHEGNVLVHWDDIDQVPNFYVGDFGSARTSDEGPEQSAAAIARLSPRARQLASSPPGSDPPSSSPDEDGSPRRHRWDVGNFITNMNYSSDSLTFPYREGQTGLPAELQAILDDLQAMTDQDDADRALRASQRPPYQDLRPIIRRAQAVENNLRRQFDASPASLAAQLALFTRLAATDTRFLTRPQAWELEELLQLAYTATPYRIVDLDSEIELHNSANDLLAQTQPDSMDWGDDDDGAADWGSLTSSPPVPADYWDNMNIDVDDGATPSRAPRPPPPPPSSQSNLQTPSRQQVVRFAPDSRSRSPPSGSRTVRLRTPLGNWVLGRSPGSASRRTPTSVPGGSVFAPSPTPSRRPRGGPQQQQQQPPSSNRGDFNFNFNFQP